MWTKAAVDEAVKSYATDKARANHLALEIEDLERQVNTAVKSLLVDEAGAKAQVITGMPHGSGVGNPTEQIALKIASGWLPPEIKEMQSDLASMRHEHEVICKRLTYVEAWMSALNERESWLVLHQFIQNSFWREVIADYSKQFDGYVTKDTLKRLRAKAFKTMYAAAGCKN